MKDLSKISWFGWLPILCLLAWDSRLTDPAFLPAWIGSVVLMLILWFTTRSEQGWHLAFPDFILAGLVCWQWISTFWAINKGEAVLNNWRWTIFLCSVFLLKRWLNKSPENLIRLRNVIILSTLLYFLAVSISLLVHYYSADVQDLYALQFPSGHKSVIAGIVILLLATQFMINHSGRSIKWGVLIWGTLLIFFLQSRTAFASWALLMLAVSIEIMQVKRTSILFRIAIGVLTTVICLIIINNKHPLIQRFNPAGFYYSETAQHRLIAWEKTLTLIKNNPFLGVGSGNWKIHLLSTGVHPYWINQNVNREWIFTRAHNDWLEIGAEVGLIGLSLWILWFICLAVSVWKSSLGLIRRYNLTGLGIYSLISLLDFPKERAEFMLLLTVIVVITDRKHPGIRVFIPGTTISLAILLSASLFYGVWRYNHELNLKQLLIARNQEEHTKVITQSEKIVNPWYTLDFSAMPIQWYTGVSAFQQGNFEKAKSHFIAAHAAHPYSHQVLNNLGSTFWQLGDPLESIRWFTKCLSMHPDFEEPRFNLAVIFANQQKYTASEEILQPVVYDTLRRREFLNEIQRMKNQ